MRSKIPSAIGKITLTAATFNGSTVTPTLINFFYGKNGTGKSTIARAIAINDSITWQTGKTATDYSILVYNQAFIDANIQKYGNLPGVFTMSEQNIDIQNKVEEKTKQKAALEKQLK